MGDLPTSNPSVSISANSIQPIQDISGVTITPAIAQLQQAFKDGIIGYDDIVNHFTQAGELRRKNAENAHATQSAQSDMPNIQRRADLEGQTIDANSQILPYKTSAQIGWFQIAPKKTALESAGLDAQIPGTNLTAQEAQQDPTGVSTTSRNLFTSLYPGQPLPKKDDGSLDYQEMGNRVAPYMQLQRLYQTDVGKAALKAVEDKKRWDLLYDDKTGMPKHPQQVLKDAAGVAPALNAAQAQGNSMANLQADAGLAHIKAARDLIKQDPNAVATVFPGGTSAGQLSTHVLAGLGNDAAAKRYQTQSRLNNELANNILESIRSLAGTGVGRILSSEVNKMGQSQPAPDAGAAVWNTWLDEREDLLKRAIKLRDNMAPGGSAGVPASEAPATAPARPVVKTQADYDALPAGTLYIDSAGTMARKQ